MKSDRNLVECLIGYTAQFALDAEYRFEADRFGRHVAEIHDQRAKAFFLTNSAIYRAVPDEPENVEVFVPPAPESPLPPQDERPAPVDPDDNAPSEAAPPPATQDAPGIGDQAADDDDVGEANEPAVFEGDVLDGTEAPADAPSQPITKESLEAMTKHAIIELAEKLDVVVVKRDGKAEIIEQLLAGLD